MKDHNSKTMRPLLIISLIIAPCLSLWAQEYIGDRMQEDTEAAWKYGRTRVYEDTFCHKVIYASNDPDCPGEILIYYRLDKASYRDSIFIVMNKETCEAMVRAMKEADKKIKDWCRIARQNNVDHHEKALGVDFPPVNIHWKRMVARYGDKTPFSLPYVWAGESDYFVPTAYVSRRGHGGISFRFVLHDPYNPSEYEVHYYLDVTGRKEFIKTLNYEKLKKRFIELNPDRSGYDALFN